VSFLGEIKRRHVFQVAAVYAVVAWLIVQIVGEVNEPLNLPAGFDTVVIVLLGVGFPIALVLAWAFDLTPAGVIRASAAGLASDTEVPTGESRGPQPDPTITPTPATEPRSSRPERLRHSVAVLPLENLSPNPHDAYFAAGIHEEILNQLTKIKALSVIARTSVRKYQETDKSIADIAEELGVATIMEGSVRYAGERVRVTAQLIDAATQDHIWSEVYERELADVFAIQADIATKIAAALEAELSLAERQSVEKLPTDSPEAYALYLRGLALFQEHGQTIGGQPGPSASMQSYLDRAIELDPQFALAYVSRAQLSASRLNQNPGVYEDSASGRAELEALAMRDAQRALAIDPAAGPAHTILAHIHQFNWRGREADESYRRAVELSPNDPHVLVSFAVFSAMNGHCQEAAGPAEQALRLDPSSPQVHNWAGMMHMYCGRQERCLAELRRSVELAPTFGMGHLLLAANAGVLGHHDEALRHTQLAEGLLRDNVNPTWISQFAIVNALLGRRTEVERYRRRLEELAETHRIPNTAWIQLYVALGDDERALEWLNAAANEPESYVGHFATWVIKFNVYNMAVLDLPRCREIRKKLGFRS
jgi:adenylate cyclase